jgi:diguanylate cyclase (GGDEF)-like protein
MALSGPDFPLALALTGLAMLAVGVMLGWLGARRARASSSAGAALAPATASPFSALATASEARDVVTLQTSYHLLEQVLDRIRDGVIVCDSDGRIVEANEAAAKLLQRDAQDVPGEDLHTLAEPTVFDADDTLIAEGGTRLRGPTGDSTAVAYTSFPLLESDGLRRWVVVLRNLTDVHRTQKRIRYLARYDALTRVPNRMEFQHRLQQASARARRAGSRAALLYVDMDGFKDVNDRLGHPLGDRALEIMARRLMESMDSGTLIGRLGGDEFAILLEGLSASADPRPAVVPTVHMLLRQLAQKFHVEGHEVILTASIGIAIFPDDADNVIDLIRNADAAMYHAKHNGGNTYGFYSADMNADAVDRLLLKSELRSAIRRNEFQLLYQPKIDLRNGHIAGCEALLRWRHSRRGDVPPAVFIPLAEENTLIFEIGEWVLGQVCADFGMWQQQVPWPGRVAVNLSLKQLRQHNFVAGVEQIFARHEVSPACVEFEITESTLADHGERTLRTLHRLYELGLHLSIDDFGTGYSSLSSLQHFPIGTLKIDQSFLRDASKEHNSAAIVGAIVGLGQCLGMDVVAEGIETMEQLALLQRIGCTLGQGHLFGEPVTGQRYLDLLLAQQQGEPAHTALFGGA